jgi:hypothetical protein
MSKDYVSLPVTLMGAPRMIRRSLRQKFGHHSAGKARHEPLQVAYQYVGEGWSFKVLYCPACQRGHVTDLVHDLPADARMARELGLRQMRPWRLECSAPEA